MAFMGEKGQKCGGTKQPGRILCDLWHSISSQRKELTYPGLQQPYPCILNPLNQENNAENPRGHMRKGVVPNPFIISLHLLANKIYFSLEWPLRFYTMGYLV